MNKHIILFSFILFSSSIFAQQPTQKDLLGEWKTTIAKNDQAKLTFLANSKLVLFTEGQSSPAFSYVADFTKNPILFNLIVKKPDGKTITWKGVLKFLDKNTIKWQVFPMGGNPTNFDENSPGTIIVLKRSE
jgi:hypothetical protein